MSGQETDPWKVAREEFRKKRLRKKNWKPTKVTKELKLE